MKTAPTTKGIVKHCLHYVRGNTLDLGAGTAKYKEDLLSHVTNYTAFDMVAGPHIDMVGDVHATGLPSGSFDTILCTEVLEHIREPWRMVEEIARLLRPGGTCILTTPFLLPFHADPHDYFRYTLEGVTWLFERARLRIVESGPFGGIGIVLGEALKFSFCNPYVHKRPGFIRRNIFRVLYRLLCLLDRSPRKQSIFYSAVYVVAEKPAS
jgi:SAM-dependent methyltransferase